jgi:hypothetical protein
MSSIWQPSSFGVPSINFYDQEKKGEMGRACSMHGKKCNTYRILLRNAEGRINGYKKIVWGGMDWIHLT